MGKIIISKPSELRYERLSGQLRHHFLSGQKGLEEGLTDQRSGDLMSEPYDSIASSFSRERGRQSWLILFLHYVSAIILLPFEFSLYPVIHILSLIISLLSPEPGFSSLFQFLISPGRSQPSLHKCWPMLTWLVGYIVCFFWRLFSSLTFPHWLTTIPSCWYPEFSPLSKHYYQIQF